MNVYQKLSLATLLGFILPFGNIWGPLIVKIRKGTLEIKFRRRLIILEAILAFIFLTSAIAVMTKGVSADFCVSLFKSAFYILLVYEILILAVAIVATILYRSR